MGTQDSVRRVPIGIHRLPTNTSGAQGDSITSRSHQETGIDQRNQGTPPQKSYREGAQTQSRFLVDLLPDTQEVRRLAPHSQPEGTESLHRSSTLPHGNSGSSPARTSAGLVGSHPRSPRRLPSCPNTSFRQKVARFLHQRRGLSIPMSSIRTLHGPENVHQGGQDNRRTSPEKRTICVRVSGRLAHHGTVCRGSPLRGSADPPAATTLGVRHQRGEIRSSAISVSSVPRLDPGFQSREGAPCPGKSREHSPVRLDPPRMCDSSSQTVDEATGAHRQSYSGSAPMQTPHACHPAPCAVSLQSSQGFALQADPKLQQGPTSYPMVDSRVQHPAGPGLPAPIPILYPYYGCFQDGVGRPLGGYPVGRFLDTYNSQASHQPSGAVDHSPSAQESPKEAEGPDGDGPVRQHVGGVLHQQTGGHPKQIAVSPDHQAPEVVPELPDRTPGRTSPGSGQRPSGRSVQTGNDDPRPVQGEGCIGGVATEPQSLQRNVQQPRTASDRPLRVGDEQAAPDILLVGSRSHGIRSGCHESVLGQDLSIRIPADSVNTQGTGQALEVQPVQDIADCTSLATTAMVPEANIHDVSGTVLPPDEEGPDMDPGQDRSSNNEDQNPEPDCMATFIRSYRAAGLSQEAAALAAKARRPSTRKTYNCRIKKFTGWCKDRKINPYKASVGKVGDFLTWTFNQNASCRSIRACRTAIASIHHGFPDGTTVSGSPILNDIIKASFNERPPPQSLTPAWDMPRALRFLAEEPFEPPDRSSMMDMSRKTAFLIAAASGRRVSDIEALSVAKHHLSFREDGVHLLPRAGYLAKNQTVNFTPEHIVLPDLRKAGNSPDDGPWCPVRALRYYLNRTRHYRGEIDHLFLTAQKPYKAASKQTISRWIVSVIRDSLERDVKQLEGSNSRGFRAHDLRSQAASWALYQGASIGDIMSAQGWSSSTSFRTVYLKDPLVSIADTAVKVLSTASALIPPASTARSKKDKTVKKRQDKH